MIQTTEVNLVRRLLSLTIFLIAANTVLTLIAQPASYWRFPHSAIRFDGLPIHSSTNPMFDFFLGHGWPAYLATVTLYAAAVWLLASVVPARLSMVAELTVILDLCYSGSNWIVVRWNAGTAGAMLYIGVAGFLLASAVLSSVGPDDANALKRMCLLMALATAIDAAFTLIGQPPGYWHNTAAVHEGNPIARYFLEIGWWAYAAYILVWIAMPWLVAVRASRLTGWTIAFAFALGGLLGGSNWLFYVWRLGLQAPVIYGMLLSVLIVRLILRPDQAASHAVESPDDSHRPVSNESNSVRRGGFADCC